VCPGTGGGFRCRARRPRAIGRVVGAPVGDDTVDRQALEDQQPGLDRIARLALVLAFLAFPFLTKGEKENPSLIDIGLVILSILACAYQFWAKDYIDNRMIYVDDLVMGDWIFGGLMIVLVLEGTRRMLGNVLPITALIFVAYTLIFTSTTTEAPNNAMPIPSCTLRRENPATRLAPSQAPAQAAAIMNTSVRNSTATAVMKSSAWIPALMV